jgi:hypothetical protein
MTPNEFKIKYPEYSNLEGDILWDLISIIKESFSWFFV